MKKNYRTIKDLVRLLNRNNEGKNFYIDDFANIGLCFINEIYNNESHQLVEFNGKNWHTMALFGLENNSVQKEIMDFIYTTDSNHWFDEPEKKYNIIIGIGESENEVAAYGKLDDGIYAINSSVTKNELKDELYQFTENEIKKFQSDLPDNLAHIVELGKVEVKVK